METFGYHLDTRMYPNISSASTSCWLFYPGGLSSHCPASVFIRSLHTLERST